MRSITGCSPLVVLHAISFAQRLENQAVAVPIPVQLACGEAYRQWGTSWTLIEVALLSEASLQLTSNRNEMNLSPIHLELICVQSKISFVTIEITVEVAGEMRAALLRCNLNVHAFCSRRPYGTERSSHAAISGLTQDRRLAEPGLCFLYWRPR